MAVIIRFPTRRVADRRHILEPLGRTPEIEELDRAWRSVSRAIKALKLQERSIVVRLRLAIQRET